MYNIRRATSINLYNLQRLKRSSNTALILSRNVHYYFINDETSRKKYILYSLKSTSVPYLCQRENNYLAIRSIHVSPYYWSDKDKEEDSKPSSKIEETVKVIEEDLKEKEKKLPVVAPKRTIWKRIEDEILHYYHGFRLLIIDIRIGLGLIFRLLNGKSLTRREHRQLIRTTSDVFRLVPFSVFIIVPFMELLLPVFIKIFPNMLPSTFQTKNEADKKMKNQLKVKLEMAKFLQETLDDMALQAKGHSSEKAKEFAQFFNKIRESGGEVSNDEIIKYSKLFEDEITLDSLSRPQLTALCRVLEIPPIANTVILRFQLRMRLRTLISDDKVIENEGVESLNVLELQRACQARGMRALGIPEDRLRRQLNQWLQLSLHEKVPPSLLLLSRAMYLPEYLPPAIQLQTTISSLPESAATQAKAQIGEREGKVDNKTRIEIIKEEERKIKEERKELKELITKKDTTTIVDPAMLVEKDDKDIKEELADIIEDMKKKELKEMKDEAKELKGLISKKEQVLTESIEKEEIKEIKEELADYIEDLHDLNKVLEKTGDIQVKESKAARRLFKRVNKMVTNVDDLIKEQENQKEALPPTPLPEPEKEKPKESS